ncbi:MAG: carboxyl transferase domain-containing protein [Desertimonas sp.]
MTISTTSLTHRVLIANRGEIAVRIARAAASLGIESVAVCSAADEASLHTRIADRYVVLPGGALDAYLDHHAVVAAAVETGCDLVHPGYGFLAESAPFATRCAESDLTFVGPSPEVLGLFGDKARARTLAAAQGIPIVAGSDGIVADADAAAAVAAELGYPVMLKAAAGGGGRGMRRVASAEEMAEAFASATREAASGFGDGSLLIERLVVDPRHIEVQVLAGADGAVTHLWERDCSLQQRHQKVIEIAPAPGLDPVVRGRLLADAVRLATAAGYVNAGTVEFLVDPARSEHFFIECNPRIQVEHTVTEQVTGVDLVAAQFRVALGATLGDLGLDGDPVPQRGAAVQARVVLTTAGPITAYREPSGPGVRVDGYAYAGYEPVGVFDPLLAKVIGHAAGSDPDTCYRAALALTERALAEFQIDGPETNIDRLRVLLALDEVAAGDARTTLIERHGPAGVAVPAPAGMLALLRGPAAPDTAPAPSPVATLPMADHQAAVISPSTATLVDLRVGPGDEVAAGQTVAVTSAMKMETVLSAPTAGRVVAVAAVAVGDTIARDQVIAVLEPGDGAGAALPAEETWQAQLDEVDELRRFARDRLAPGSVDPGVVRQRTRGKLTCRERVERLLDPGSFREIGSVAGFRSLDAAGSLAEFTPANHVGGWGTVESRQAIVCADDFTSRGGHSDGAIGSKSSYLDELSIQLRVPSVRLLDGSSGGGSVASMVPSQGKAEGKGAKESSGAIKAGQPRVVGPGGSFLPPHLGSTMYAEQLDTVPVVNVLMGSVVGLGAAKAVLGHFSVMLRDTAQLMVAGPPVVIQATGEDITKEDLGGWHIHGRNGSVDNVADSEDEALDQTRRFLSYLPSSVYEAPPVTAAPSGDPAAPIEELLAAVPRNRTTTFDIRRVIELVCDPGSFFEIGPFWGTDQVVGLARIQGRPIGVVASDSRHANGGALTADGCDKITRHLQMCDLFNIPVLNLVDNPGFAVGLAHETAGTIRKGGEWMLAFARVSVPMFTVVLRRSFGVAGNNFAAPRARSGVRVFWPAADLGGIPPEGGIEAAYKRQLAEADDPAALRAELMARIETARGPVGPLNRFQAEEMIDPRLTRRYLAEWIELATRQVTHANRLTIPRARPVG